MKVHYEELLRKEQENVFHLTQARNQLRNSITFLKETLSKNRTLVAQLQRAKDAYIKENKKLQESNKENESQIKTLRSQVEKLRELYVSTQSLLQKLSTAGDMFTEFGKTIGDTSESLEQTEGKLADTQENYDQTLDRMTKLLEKLKKESFNDLDDNNDGRITEDEFRNYVNE